jgi:glutamine amidotransferase
MCRLFGLHAGNEVITATFWLLNAPDSLTAQSRRNPDGTGLGVFDRRGRPEVRKQPIAAWQDARIFAHNGVVQGLDVLDARLRAVGSADLVLGQTDSERVFALITASVRAHDGDVQVGLVDAMQWLAANVPIYAVNVLLSTATDMWALRYPEPNELYVLDRRHFAPGRGFNLRTRRISAHSKHLQDRPSVVFASEPMDDDPRWRLIAPGELVHVDAELQISTRHVLPDPPKHQLRREDLTLTAEVANKSDHQK